MSYFGTDQSQVQRYLSGKSLKEMQLGMIFNGILKIPMQFFILFIGVMVFVFYQFNSSPINFNPQSISTVNNSTYEKDYNNLQNELNNIFNEKQHQINNYLSGNYDAKYGLSELELKEKKLRLEAKNLIALASQEKNIKVETNDKDYVFITFILENLPKGLIGLLLAVILSAAMSSTSSEINALATTTAIDIYKRNKKNVTDDQLVKSTKFFTFLWGMIAIGIACVAYLADNLIQLVNIIGSIFYGNVLGIFLIAFFFKFIKSNAIFYAAIITQIIIIYGWYNDWMPFLWLNVFGCIVVITISSLLQLAQKN
jgi:Na+/proline symporter